MSPGKNQVTHRQATAKAEDCHWQGSTFNERITHYMLHPVFQIVSGSLQQAPKFIQDSYIKVGYRVNFNKKRQALKSLFMWHNELINIWTHLLGALFVLLLIGYVTMNYSQVWKDKTLDEIRERFDSLVSEVKLFDAKLDQSIDTGYHSITEIKNKLNTEFHNRVIDLTKEFSLLAEFTMDEVESVRLNLLENLHTKDYIEAFDEYRAKLINIIESKDFDWIDFYRKLSNQSDEEWEKDRNSTHISRWPIVVFLLAAAACMGGSAVFHTFYCISATANKILLRIDYAGICFLIAGSSLPPYYYGFYCQPVYAWLYGGINCVMGSVVFIVSMCDFIHTVEYRPLKGRMYAALGISGAFGGIHLMMTTDDVLQGYEFASWTPYYLLMGVTYLGGLAIFQIRWPEKQRPVTFDNCGQSHQLWHMSVVVAVFLTYIGALGSYYSRISAPCKAT